MSQHQAERLPSVLSVLFYHSCRTFWYIEFPMEWDVFGENEAATSVESEAVWDTAETSPHVTEGEGEEEMSRGEMCKVSD